MRETTHIHYTNTNENYNEILSTEVAWDVTPCRFLNSYLSTECNIAEGNTAS
jgi:hypothetical protein